MSEPNYTTHAQAGEMEGPSMSTPETLSGIFFEPGRTFEALRARPRFLVAGLIAIAAFMAFYVTYVQRIGYEKLIDSEVAVAKQSNPNMTDEQAAQGAQIQKGAIVKTIRTWSPAIVIAIFFAIGAAIYLLGTNLMGGKMSYKQALAVWVYSALPPILVTEILNFVLLFVSPPEEAADIAQGAGRGLVRASPGALVDGSAHPVLATALGSLDLIALYGLFLAALGLRKVGRLKKGSAWTVVLILWGIGVAARIISALVFGRAS
jgi:hypothetical protein